MKKMKKLLSAVLALAMMLSMIVLPVSAEEAREQFRMSDDKQFVLEAGGQAHYYLSALLDGYGILYDGGNASYSISICDADGNSVKLHDWNEGSYVGYGFKVEEGKTYNIDISNNTAEAVSYNVYMWLAESYGDLTMSQTAYAGNAQTTVNLTVSSETAMAFEPITWTSSDPGVAAIGTGSNMSRVIDLVAPGTATVTATTASGLTATCEVTVKKQETIIPGETKSFTLDANQGVFFNFVPTESGKYIVYVPANTCYFGVAVGDDYVTGSEVSAGYWESDDALSCGMAFDAEAGKNYVIKAANDLPTTAIDCQLTLVNADAMAEGDAPATLTLGSFDVSIPAEAESVEYRFTPAEDGNYLFYWTKGSSSFGFIVNELGGDWVDVCQWKNADGTLQGQIFPMTAGTTYTVQVMKWDPVALSMTATLVKTAPYESIRFATPEPCYLDRWTQLNLIGSPEFSCDTVIWTNSNPDAVEISASDNTSATIKGIDLGTATITATTASGVTASCEVTVQNILRPALGETVEIEVPYQGEQRIEFSPEEDGVYVFRYPSEYELEMECCMIMSDGWCEDLGWTSGTYRGAAYQLQGGNTYAVWVKNSKYSPTVKTSLTVTTAEGNAAETIAPGETKDFILNRDQQETFLFTPAESGRYIVYRPVSAGYYVDFYQGTDMDNATQVLTDNWQDSDFKYQGYAFDAEAGKTYLIRVVNWWSETPIDCQLSLMKAANYETFEIEWDVSGLVGSESWVSVSYGPENASEAVTWASSDETVVRIESAVGTDAQLKLVGSGAATVTATSASGKKASCTVTVSQELSVALGETVELTLDAGASAYYNFAPAETGRYILTMPADRLMDTMIFDENIGWKSGDIWMNGDGTKAGYAFDLNAGIGYSMEVYNNYSETVSLTLTLVKAGNFDSIRFPKTAYSGYLGGFLTLALIGSPEYADEPITWTSSNNDVAYIEYADGVMADIILADIGTATITATTAGGKKATCTITVKDMIELIKDKPVSAKIGMGETAVCYFEAPSSGTYSLYAAGEGYSECVVFDGRTGMVLNGDYWYQNGAEGADYVMTAGGVYLIYVVNMSDADINCSIGIGQRTKATGMYFAEESGTVYRGVQLMLEPYFKPVLAQREDVTWTTGNSDIVKFSRKYEEGPYVSYYFDAISAGTTTVTAKSAGGFTAKYTVTVLEPEDLELGEHLTPEMDGWDFVVYNIIPETSGKHFIRWTDSDKTHVQLWHPTKEFDGRNYMDGDEEVIEAELTAGEEYFLLFQNMTEDVRSFEFRLEGAPHVHAPELVTEKTATFTEDGVKAHYACACGALFADEAGAVEITASDILIPKQIQVESGKAEVGKDAVNDAAQNIEKGGEVSIPVADVSEDAKSAALPVESLTRIAEKEAVLTVEMPEAAVTMDTAALETVAEKAGDHASVTLEVAEIPREDLTETQMAAIKELDRNLVTAISAELMVNGQNIATKADKGFGGGKVTVKIPVKLSGDFTVLYIADDGSVEVIENAAYENGVLTMELEHFSTYAILQDSQPGDVNDDGAINVLDLMYLANYFAKGEVINKANADVNADGALNVLDLMYLANFFAGKETTLG